MEKYELVVRVGTHAVSLGSRTTLWKRLSKHKGVTKTGGGNHRGSIFRRIIGQSLINRDNLKSPSWGNRKLKVNDVGDSELSIERMVSNEIRAMPFLWVDIGDEANKESDRGVVERGSIALLSNWQKESIDAASDTWLGHYSIRELDHLSGLWNSNHVKENYDSSFLDVFEKYVNRMDFNQ